MHKFESLYMNENNEKDTKLNICNYLVIITCYLMLCAIQPGVRKGTFFVQRAQKWPGEGWEQFSRPITCFLCWMLFWYIMIERKLTIGDLYFLWTIFLLLGSEILSFNLNLFSPDWISCTVNLDQILLKKLFATMNI